jgi:hypothetical protein
LKEVTLLEAERAYEQYPGNHVSIEREQIKAQMGPRTKYAVDRWVDEQMFEEDVRAVLRMMRPNHRERLMGWSEYRTGGTHFRVTIAWDEEFAKASAAEAAVNPLHGAFSVPGFVEVLESLLMGSVRSEAELTAEEECDAYRAVLGELCRRVDAFQECSG